MDKEGLHLVRWIVDRSDVKDKEGEVARHKNYFIILIFIRGRISIIHFLQYITIIRLLYTLFYILRIFKLFCTFFRHWHYPVIFNRKWGKKAHDCACPLWTMQSKETKTCSGLCESRWNTPPPGDGQPLWSLLHVLPTQHNVSKAIF